MNIDIKKSFERDLKKIQDRKLLNSILDVIDNIQESESLSEIKHIKKNDWW